MMTRRGSSAAARVDPIRFPHTPSIATPKVASNAMGAFMIFRPPSVRTEQELSVLRPSRQVPWGCRPPRIAPPRRDRLVQPRVHSTFHSGISPTECYQNIPSFDEPGDEHASSQLCTQFPHIPTRHATMQPDP